MKFTGYILKRKTDMSANNEELEVSDVNVMQLIKHQIDN